MDGSWPIERHTRPAREPLRLLLDSTDEPAGYVLFVAAATGFSIVERDGERPHPDAVLQVDDRAYRIVAVRRSPFPRDPRPCLVLEPQR
jgi:hypothetical protein